MASGQSKRGGWNRQDLTGQCFGRLTVLSYAGSGPCGKAIWLCRCTCGAERRVPTTHLRRGNTKSCGCLRDEKTSLRATRHGRRRTPEYRAWQNMKDRCTNPHNKEYANYGGRGITVCPEWLASFKAFFACLGSSPSRRHTLGRIDNERGYEPGNVRWETWMEQGRNSRRNRRLTWGGETLHLEEWGRRVGIDARCIRKRLKRGWSVEDALGVTPPTPPGRGARP